MARRVPLPVSVIGTVLLLVINASAAPAPYGAYLGCYNLNSMGLSSNERTVRSTGVSNYKSCPSKCSSARASLVIIGTSSRNYECRCGFSVPPNSAKTAESNCNPGGSGVAVFYRHSAATTQQCRVFQPSPDTSNWRAAYNSYNAIFSNGNIRLRMNGYDGGTRVHSTYPRQRYGQFQVRGRIPCGSGVIGAFYLRSNENYPNYGTFDEIDFEYVTFRGQACSIWLNAWQGSYSSGERQCGQTEYRRLLGWPSGKTTATDFVTYTIDWQPGYVSWYVDGRLLQRYAQGERLGNGNIFRVPNLPMRPTFSLWTDTRQNPFGGPLNPSQGPWEETFNNVRQVVCDRPAPATTPLGPRWMYA